MVSREQATGPAALRGRKCYRCCQLAGKGDPICCSPQPSFVMRKARQGGLTQTLSFTHRPNPHPPTLVSDRGAFRAGVFSRPGLAIREPTPMISAPLFQRDGTWDDPATLFPMSALHGCASIESQARVGFCFSSRIPGKECQGRPLEHSQSAGCIKDHTTDRNKDLVASRLPPCALILDDVVGDVVGHMGSRYMGDGSRSHHCRPASILEA